jgi:MoxR-like ATPase
MSDPYPDGPQEIGAPRAPQAEQFAPNSAALASQYAAVQGPLPGPQPSNPTPNQAPPNQAPSNQTLPHQAPPNQTLPHQAPPAHAAVDPVRQSLLDVRREVAKAVVGQDAAVTGMLIALLARGHVLLEGVPGVAKTLLVRALSAALSLDTKRLQFTPDLMPGDVTGSLVYDPQRSDFTFRPGPVFTNILLADEINRTPPKTQAALLEAMEEHQVTVDGVSRVLPAPFLVAATQNPVEYEGTYPLPEAQLDRFLLKLSMLLPGRNEEIEVVRRHSMGFDPQDLAAAGIRAVAGALELEQARDAVHQVAVAPEVMAYMVDVVRATRAAPSFQLGVSPRGATALLNTARAWAWLSGRAFVTPDDVKALTLPALRHRVALRPEAQMDGVSVDNVLGSILATVVVPR